MNIENCQITRYPVEVLRQKAEPVEKIDDDIRRLVEKMTEIMLENKGIGLAAPQAGVPLRLFIISLEQKKGDVKVFINPTVTTSGRLIATEEGCLSVPGIYTKIKRYEKATVTAMNLDGNEFTEDAEGLYARCLQHEFDHLEGTTIADRMTSAARIKHRKQLKRLEQEHKNSM